MKKYKHKTTGVVVKQHFYKETKVYPEHYDYEYKRSETAAIHSSIDAMFVENSNDWEEVKEEPNYLITAFKRVNSFFKLSKDGRYYPSDGIPVSWNLKTFIDEKFEIYSVKNSKGEEFTIGDKFTVGGGKNNYKFEVLSFCIEDSRISIRINVDGIKDKIWLDDAYKVKTPIYTTTDGKEIYEGELIPNLFLLRKGFNTKYETKIDSFSQKDKIIAEKLLTFTSEENRDKYIKENSKKPVFVSADGKDMFEGYRYYVPQIDSRDRLTGTYLEFITDTRTVSHGPKKFSTKSAAQEYIDNNKPKFSFADIFTASEKIPSGYLTTTGLLDELKKLGK